MKKYIVPLNHCEEEPFEAYSDIVMCINALNDDGEALSHHCRVQIEFSKNALLGLGSELIRLANCFQEGYHTHLFPAEKNLISQKMGVYLTPDSCELIIDCASSQPIESYFQ